MQTLVSRPPGRLNPAFRSTPVRRAGQDNKPPRERACARTSRSVLGFVALAAFAASCAAQGLNSGALAVGSGPGEIGVVRAINEDCRGPATISASANGGLAVLDRVNNKIVVLGADKPRDVPLPNDLLEPADLTVTARGYLVVGAAGDAVLVTEKGEVLTRQRTAYDPTLGSPRLVFASDAKFAIENLKGERTRLTLDAGAPLVAGVADAASYVSKASGPGKIDLSSNRFPTINITSSIRINGARALWADKEQGVLIAVQETRQLPRENTFVRLIKADVKGVPISETYLDAETFACDTVRPYTRLTDGRVVSLRFEADKLSLKVLAFSPVGTAQPVPVAEGSSALLIAAGRAALEKLEEANGSTDAITVSMSEIDRPTILARARAALEFQWQLTASAYSQPDVENRCSPPDSKWARAKILEGKGGTTRTGLPYAWGSYIANLDAFAKRLENGALASNVCTCRNADCVNKRATGVDCSGFVSFAWRTGNYYTTASLPNKNVSTQIPWVDVKPGDIVNKAGSHVRLVESVSQHPSGNYLTVIESTTLASCGGVCRRSYSEAELQRAGYKPHRRSNVRD
jgi:hypothetical protein